MSRLGLITRNQIDEITHNETAFDLFSFQVGESGRPKSGKLFIPKLGILRKWKIVVSHITQGSRTAIIGPRFSKFCRSWFGPVRDLEIFLVLVWFGPRIRTERFWFVDPWLSWDLNFSIDQFCQSTFCYNLGKLIKKNTYGFYLYHGNFLGEMKCNLLFFHINFNRKNTKAQILFLLTQWLLIPVRLFSRK